MSIRDEDIVKKVLDTQEKIASDITDVKVTLGKQEENLRLHVYRTDLAEKNIEILREEIKPIKQHIYYLNGALKFVGGISLVLTIVSSALIIIKNFESLLAFFK